MMKLEEYHQQNLSLLEEKRRLKQALAEKGKEIDVRERALKLMAVDIDCDSCPDMTEDYLCKHKLPACPIDIVIKRYIDRAKEKP